MSNDVREKRDELIKTILSVENEIECLSAVEEYPKEDLAKKKKDLLMLRGLLRRTRISHCEACGNIPGPDGLHESEGQMICEFCG